MKDGYIPIRVMVPTGPGTWSGTDLWQEIKDGKQIRVVTREGVEVTVPEVHEAIATNNEIHFAPGVPNDPNAYTPPSLAAMQEAIAKGPEAYAAWVSEEWAAAKAREPLLPSEVVEATVKD